MTSDLPTLIILTQREHQRLKNQIKRLSTYALSEQDLKTYRAYWIESLGFVEFLPPLLQAMDDLLDRLKHGKATDDAYMELIFQIGIYQKGSWSYLRAFYGSLSPYVDRWLKVLPMYKFQFDQRYEPDRKLSVAEQGALIRSLIEAIPNKDDPYNLRQSQEGRAMLNDLGILEEARDKQNKPDTTGQVVDFQRFKNRRR